MARADRCRRRVHRAHRLRPRVLPQGRRLTAGAGRGPALPREVTAADVVELLDLLESSGVRVWLEGGWAVDALLGAPTRRHSDLDIVVEWRCHDAAVEALRGHGFAPVARPDTRAWNFVLGDARGRDVDFHVLTLEASGDGRFGPRSGEPEAVYPAAALTGHGVVAGRSVACITPEWLVRFHLGYPPDDEDVADVLALCARFDIEVPGEYAAYRRG